MSKTNINIDTFLTRRKCEARSVLGKPGNHDKLEEFISFRRQDFKRTQALIKSVQTIASTKRQKIAFETHQNIWRSYHHRLDAQRKCFEQQLFDITSAMCTSPDFDINEAEELLQMLEDERKRAVELKGIAERVSHEIDKVQARRDHDHPQSNLHCIKSMFVSELTPDIEDERSLRLMADFVDIEDVCMSSLMICDQGIHMSVRDLSVASDWKEPVIMELNELQEFTASSLVPMLQDQILPSRVTRLDITRMYKMIDEYSTISRNRHTLLNARWKTESPSVPFSSAMEYCTTERKSRSLFEQQLAHLKASQCERIQQILSTVLEIRRAEQEAGLRCSTLSKTLSRAERAHALIWSWRATMNEKELKIKIQAEQEELELKTKRMKLADKDKRRRQRDKLKLDMHWLKLKEERELEEAKILELKQHIQKDQALRLREGQKRVSMRQKLWDEERSQKRHIRENKEREEEHALNNRLQKLRTMVSSRVQAQRDPTRLHQMTVARISSMNAIQDEQLFTSHGYTNETVFRDPRSRLLELLKDTVMSPPTQRYVSSVMNQLQLPTIGYARDWKSQIHFGADS